MRQIINNLYLLFLRIINLAYFVLRKNILIYFFKEFVYTLSPPPPHAAEEFPVASSIKDIINIINELKENSNHEIGAYKITFWHLEKQILCTVKR